MKKLSFALALAGILASPAAAQIVVQPNPLAQNPLILVENKDVQRDLKLSEEQAKKLAELSRIYADKVRGLGFQAPDIEKRKKANKAALDGLGDVLDSLQAKRLKQLELQQCGAGAFGDPQIARELALTKKQRKAIFQTLQGFNPKWIAINQAAKGNPQEIRKKLAELHRDFTANVLKTLIPDQQAEWKNIAGPPLAGSFPAMTPFFVDMRPQPVLNWHLNDLAAAQAEAKKTGKPIFVTFRCEA